MTVWRTSAFFAFLLTFVTASPAAQFCRAQEQAADNDEDAMLIPDVVIVSRLSQCDGRAVKLVGRPEFACIHGHLHRLELIAPDEDDSSDVPTV